MNVNSPQPSASHPSPRCCDRQGGCKLVWPQEWGCPGFFQKKPSGRECGKAADFSFTSKGRECCADSELRRREQPFRCALGKYVWNAVVRGPGPPPPPRNPQEGPGACLVAVFLEPSDRRLKLQPDEPKIKLMALLDILFVKFNFLMCTFITLGMALSVADLSFGGAATC